MEATECDHIANIPDALNISTVKKIMESMPLTCWIINNTRPMDNGSRTGRVNSTFLDIGSTSSVVAAVVPSGLLGTDDDSTVATVWVADTGISMVFTSNFSHCTEFSASRLRFLLRSQMGESGRKYIAILRQTAMKHTVFQRVLVGGNV